MTDEEDVTAQLLRLAGAPPEPPAERRARVRQAVHGAWRAPSGDGGLPPHRGSDRRCAASRRR